MGGDVAHDDTREIGQIESYTKNDKGEKMTTWEPSSCMYVNGKYDANDNDNNDNYINNRNEDNDGDTELTVTVLMNMKE